MPSQPLWLCQGEREVRIEGSVHDMLGSLYLRYCNINLTACATIKKQELISLNDVTI